MQISQVEQRVGISKKNIRFYEQEGLLHPKREAGNGYRDYGEEDILRLEKIKLMRKLSVPLEEIRVMLEGGLTLSEGMNRHLFLLERQRKSLETAQCLCRQLLGEPGSLDELDAGKYLQQIEELEREGAHFLDMGEDNKNKRKKIWGSWISAAFFLVLVGLVEGFIIWGLSVEPLPFLMAALFLSLPPAFGVGILLALRSRIREIQKGEEDEYKNY